MPAAGILVALLFLLGILCLLFIPLRTLAKHRDAIPTSIRVLAFAIITGLLTTAISYAALAPLGEFSLLVAIFIGCTGSLIGALAAHAQALTPHNK